MQLDIGNGKIVAYAGELRAIPLAHSIFLQAGMQLRVPTHAFITKNGGPGHHSLL